MLYSTRVMKQSSLLTTKPPSAFPAVFLLENPKVSCLPGFKTGLGKVHVITLTLLNVTIVTTAKMPNFPTVEAINATGHLPLPSRSCCADVSKAHFI